MRVLLAEDNQDHAELIQVALAKNFPRARVTHVADGQEALDYLFGQGEYEDPSASQRPDLILLDLKMPRIDGFSVLERIRATPGLASLTVIVLTTSAASTDIDKAFSLGADGYFTKGADFADMVERLGNLAPYLEAKPTGDDPYAAELAFEQLLVTSEGVTPMPAV